MSYPTIPVTSLSEGRRLVCMIREMLGQLGLSPPTMIVGDFPHAILVSGTDEHVKKAVFFSLLRFVMNRPIALSLADGSVLEGEISYGISENDSLCFHDHDYGKLQVYLPSIKDISLVDSFCDECHGRHKTADCPHMQIELGQQLAQQNIDLFA